MGTNMSGERTWTAEQDAILRRMIGEKATSQEVADRLGSKTRNAVIGRAKRLGLNFSHNIGQFQTGRPRKEKNPVPWPEKPASKPLPKPKAKPAGPIRLQSKPVSIFQAHPLKGCRWPLWGDYEDIPIGKKKFCGGEGYPWCEFHRQMGHVRVNR